jgi:hypothetical protein
MSNFLSGVPAKVIYDLKQQNTEESQRQEKIIFQDSQFKEYTFLIKAKTDFYNDQSKVKYTIVRQKPRDYIGENNCLLDLMGSLSK